MLVYDSIKVPYRGSHHAEAYFSGSKNTNKMTTFRNKKPRGSHGSALWLCTFEFVLYLLLLRTFSFIFNQRRDYVRDLHE